MEFNPNLWYFRKEDIIPQPWTQPWNPGLDMACMSIKLISHSKSSRAQTSKVTPAQHRNVMERSSRRPGGLSWQVTRRLFQAVALVDQSRSLNTLYNETLGHSFQALNSEIMFLQLYIYNISQPLNQLRTKITVQSSQTMAIWMFPKVRVPPNHVYIYIYIYIICIIYIYIYIIYIYISLSLSLFSLMRHSDAVAAAWAGNLNSPSWKPWTTSDTPRWSLKQSNKNRRKQTAGKTSNKTTANKTTQKTNNKTNKKNHFTWHDLAQWNLQNQPKSLFTMLWHWWRNCSSTVASSSTVILCSAETVLSAKAARSAGEYSLSCVVLNSPFLPRPILVCRGRSGVTRHFWIASGSAGRLTASTSVGLGLSAPSKPCAKRNLATPGMAAISCTIGRHHMDGWSFPSGSAGCSRIPVRCWTASAAMASRQNPKRSFPSLTCASSRSARERSPQSSAGDRTGRGWRPPCPPCKCSSWTEQAFDIFWPCGTRWATKQPLDPPCMDATDPKLLDVRICQIAVLLVNDNIKRNNVQEKPPNFTTALFDTSSTAQGGGGSFKNRKPIGDVRCCESGMAERSHWLTERWLELCLLEWLQWLQWSPHPQLLDVVWCTATVVVVVA